MTSYHNSMFVYHATTLGINIFHGILVTDTESILITFKMCMYPFLEKITLDFLLTLAHKLNPKLLYLVTGHSVYVVSS